MDMDVAIDIKQPAVAKTKTDTAIQFLLGRPVQGPILIPINTLNTSACLEKGKLQQVLGSGTYGSVFTFCDKEQDCKYVLKVQNLGTFTRDGNVYNTTPTYWNEVYVHAYVEKNSTVGVVPKLYNAWTCTDDDVQGRNTIGIGLMQLDKWDGSLETLRSQFGQATVASKREIFGHLQSAMKVWVRELRDLRIQHNDIFDRNVLFRIRDNRIEFALTDWGLAFVRDSPDVNERQTNDVLDNLERDWGLLVQAPPRFVLRPPPINAFLPLDRSI